MIEGATKISSIFLKKFLPLLSFLLFAGIAYGQQGNRVSGKVTGVNGEPLESATIAVKGQNVSTISNAKGEYVITGSFGPNSILVFSFTGYQTREEKVGDKKVINVELKLEDQTLDDVVIIGYGEVKRKDLTGAISVIKPSENATQQF
ncbi:MAG TPA: carboxypeptidase-like regulatory domain-containing protein, partial [Ginsengibacter sp.]|nr:carboxypeptidase-like regulatory domain-containing protein [Ginsengibacter sp.]